VYGVLVTILKVDRVFQCLRGWNLTDQLSDFTLSLPEDYNPKGPLNWFVRFTTRNKGGDEKEIK